MIANLIRERRRLLSDATQNPNDAPETPDLNPSPLEEDIAGVGPDEIAEAEQALAEHEQSRSSSVPEYTHEMDDAQEADRSSRFTAGMELAGRQLVGGITRTPVSQGIGPAPSRVPQAKDAAKSRAARAADVLRQRQQGAEFDRLKTNDAAAVEERALGRSERAAAILLAQKKEADALERHNRERSEDREDRQANTKAIREQTNTALGFRGSAEKRDAEKFDADKAEKAAKKSEDVPPGYEISAGSTPSGETRKKFTALVSSAEKMKGLTAQMRAALKGTTGMSRTLDPATVTKLKQLGTMIRIEGKNVAGLGALSGPDMGLMDAIAADPTSIKANLTVDLPRMLDQLDAWGDNSVAGDSKATGIVRSGAKAGGADEGEIRVAKNGAKLRVFKDGTSEVVE